MISEPFDPKDLRNAFGNFATGVTVTTTMDTEGNPRGFTANSFSSVSLDPPLVLVCLAKTALSYSLFNETESFAVNILGEAQQWIANQFASANSDKYADVNWQPSNLGNPLLENVVCWLDCTRHQVIDAGDHIILMGRVKSYAYDAGSPLGYCQGGYVSFGLNTATLTSPEPGNTLYGAIVEHEDSVLMIRSKGEYALPTAHALGSVQEVDSLLGKMASAGIDAELPFLFAIYNSAGNERQNVIYRGHARSVLPEAESAFIAMKDIPFEAIKDDTMRTMLQRFVRERQQDEFGLFREKSKD